MATNSEHTHNCTICQSTVRNAYFHCQAACTYHVECLDQWIQHCKDSNKTLLCPNCNTTPTANFPNIIPTHQFIQELQERIKFLERQIFGLQQTNSFYQFKLGLHQAIHSSTTPHDSNSATLTELAWV
jgi:hypothetical protein